MNIRNFINRIVLLFLLLFISASLIAGDVPFISYSSNASGQYTYNKSPLGTNYTEAWQKTFANNGKDWAMKTTVTKYNVVSGALLLDGVTVLTDKNLVSGFTGGTFVVAKDMVGTALCVVSAKTNLVLDSTSASDEAAEAYGWGVNPAKLGFTWKKGFYPKPTERQCSWHAVIPAYVMEFNPTIEVVQCHTPSNRALRGLQEFAKYALSFIITNGVSIADLANKAQNNTLVFDDFVNFSNNVIDWAKIQGLITSAQAVAAKNIINAIDAMENEGIIGLQPKNHAALVSLAYAIQKAVNDKNTAGTESAKEILESLESLLQNQNAFVPTALTHIETIMVNLKVLINDKLDSKQKVTYDRIISVIRAINALPEGPVYKHMDLVFEGIVVVINISEQGNNGTLTPGDVKAGLDPLLDKIGTALIAEYGQYSLQVENFLAFRKIADNVYIIINNGNTGWNSENLTTLINGFTILSAAIDNKDLSIDVIMQFNEGIMQIINNNGGWSFDNASALIGIIEGLQAYVQHPLLTQLKQTIISLNR